MAWRSDTSVSAAVDVSRALDLIDDGLEGDVLPEEDVSPAIGAAPPVVYDADDDNIFECA